MEKKKTTGNSTVNYLIKEGLPLTITNYIGLNWMGGRTPDPRQVDEDEGLFLLEGEELAEVEGLIEAGLLVATDNRLEKLRRADEEAGIVGRIAGPGARTVEEGEPGGARPVREEVERGGVGAANWRAVTLNRSR